MQKQLSAAIPEGKKGVVVTAVKDGQEPLLLGVAVRLDHGVFVSLGAEVDPDNLRRSGYAVTIGKVW